MAAQNRNSKFVLQVYDGEKYRPCYIAPHATDKLYGDTKIVDTVNTPTAEGKDGDKTAANTSIVPSPKAVNDAIVRALQNENLPAARAKHLTTGKTIKFSGGGSFEATLKDALSVDYQEVNFTGVLPLSAIPQGAQERLVICKDKNTALTQAKNGEIQQGDVVQIPEDGNDGHNIMYYMCEAYSTNATFDSLFKVFSAGHATDADKLNTNAGSSAKPVYFSGGVPVACSSTIGGTAKPVYMNGGTITACSSTIGGTAKPVYMNGGTITACSSTVGGGTIPAYMNGGTITACTPYSEASVKYATSAGSATSATTATALSSSAGSATQPIYFSNGKPVACSYTLAKSVPSNAVFTDTTYTALKNPNALKISLSGGSTSSVTYDGSTAQSLTIPIPTIPSSLKNPSALSFSGASTVTYDGSTSQSVTIPVKVTD